MSLFQVQRQKRSGGERQSSEVVRANSSQLGSPVRRAFGEETEEEGGRLRGEQERQPLILQEEEGGGRRGASRRGYEIREITEMGRMAGLFFSRGGRNLFYICLVKYLSWICFIQLSPVSGYLSLWRFGDIWSSSGQVCERCDMHV